MALEVSLLIHNEAGITLIPRGVNYLSRTVLPFEVDPRDY